LGSLVYLDLLRLLRFGAVKQIGDQATKEASNQVSPPIDRVELLLVQVTLVKSHIE